MREHVTKKDDPRREYQIAQFQKLYLEYWIGKGKKPQQLVDRIKEMDPTAKVDYKQISKWSKGNYPPGLRYLTIIIEIFKEDLPSLDLSYFSYDLKDHSEIYQFDKQYADQVEDQLEIMAHKHFGIDLGFFEALRKLIPDFDKRYPVFTPLRFSFTNGRYERMGSAPTNGHGLFRISKDGETIFLTKYDFKILRSIQNKIIKNVSAWFDMIAADLSSAETSINLDYIERNPPGADYFIAIPDATTDDYLQRFDHWGMYTEEECKKYGLTKQEVYDSSTIVVTKDDDGNEKMEKGSINDGEY